MPKFINTADWHIRPDRPICRTDVDWIETQRKQISFVSQKAKENLCPIIINGDLTHKSQIPDYLKNIIIDELKGNEVYGIAGNHCLPYHSWDNVNDSSYGVLNKSGIIKNIPIGSYKHFGQDIVKVTGDKILFIHELIFEKNIPPNINAKTALDVLNEYPEYDWIFAGDQHHGFHFQRGNRHVVNAGCLNRQAVDFKDYKPVIWLIDTDNNTCESIEVPDDPELITDSHIVQRDEKEERVAAFVSLIKDTKSISLDFEENVTRALRETDRLDDDTITMILRLMEG